VDSVTVIGCVQVDLVMTPVPDLPHGGGTLFVDEMSLRVGGAGANAALALAEAGVRPRLIGCIGDDRLGRWMLDELPNGLGEELFVSQAGRTGLTVACEAPGRDRTFLTYLGVNETWSLQMIAADALAARHVLFCDYFCAPSLQGDAAHELLGTARASGATTYFDTAWDPHGWPAPTREEVQRLLPLVDVFLPNEAEACALAGVTDSVTGAARALQQLSGGWVVVKLGARGCLAVGPEGAELEAAAPRTAVIDSTGAGDAFNAGLIAALADGRDWRSALGAATTLASEIVSRPSDARFAAASSTEGD
jgi:sugar/nucleoside kinase (ribokinase family)